jgi:hypothetical protein
MQTFMLVFNHVCEGKMPLARFAGHRLLVTHIQADELRATANDQKREALLSVFAEIGPIPVPTESAAWNISKWDQAKWGDGNLFRPMFERLRQLDPTHKEPANQFARHSDC